MDSPARVKFLCSFGGSLLPRPQDGKLRYVGGETTIVSLPKDILFEEVILKMKELFESAVILKYQQPDKDLGALVSVVNDADVINMMEECDKLGGLNDGFARLRLFLFPQHETPMNNDLEKVGSGSSIAVEMSLGELERNRMRRFSEEDLTSITDDFSSHIGSGGYGDVFKGQFPNGVKVAVKKLKNIAMDVLESTFMAEVRTMSSISHRYLVRLYGYCFETEMKALVYEYLENGSLDKILYENHLNLPWEKLYDIAINTAKGFSYLHESCIDEIVHYDVKAGNVLLDKNLLPKIADFGLAKITSRDLSHISLIAFRGTRNYAAPEMWMQLPATCKSDVYSFGMMLFEVLGRRRNLDGQDWFPGQVWAKFSNGELDKVLDDCGIEDEDKENAKTLTILALWCTQHMPDHRPTMSEVVQVLEGIKQLPPPPNPFYPYSVSSSTSTRGSVSTNSSRRLPSQFFPVASLISAKRENPVGLWKNAVEYSILENVAAMKIQHAFRNYQTQIKIRAAARIQSKFRLENVAAMKIQHAFRNYQTRIKIRAAARIQSKFRTWKLRKDFLNMRFVKHSDNFVKHSVIYL